MSNRTYGRSPKMIQNVFVLLLLSVFAILSTFLVTIGAQLYRNTVDSSEKNNSIRIVTTVLRSTIWAEDGGEGRLEVEEFEHNGEKVPVLSIVRDYSSPEDTSRDNIWVKRVFVYDGYLREGYNEYYTRIPRKDLKAGQRYLEIEPSDDGFGDEFADETAEAAAEPEAEIEQKEIFEEVIRPEDSEKYDGYQKAEKDGGNGDGDPEDEVYVLRGFNPAEDGEPLCELLGFEPSRDGRMLTVKLETVDHQTSTVRLYMRTGGAE